MSAPDARARRAAAAVVSLGAKALATLLLAAVLGAITILLVLPWATQGAALTVLTGSMTPEIPVGSVALVRPVDTATLQVGDVATYQVAPDKQVYITHRIMTIENTQSGNRFVFQGDANPRPDTEPVTPEAIRGEVWFHVPYLGSIRDGLNGPSGLSLLAALVLGGYALSQVWAAARGRRHDDGRPAALTDIVCTRHVVVARLPRAAGDPDEVVAVLGGVVLASTDESFDVLITSDEGSSEALLASVAPFAPVAVQSQEPGGSTVTFTSASTTSTSPAGQGQRGPANAYS